MSIQIKLSIFCGLLCFAQYSWSIVIITYNNAQEVIQDRSDFTMSDRIDDIKNYWDDDFSQQGPFAVEIGLPPTANFLSCGDACVMDPSYDENYLTQYYQALTWPTTSTDLRRNDFNLSSGNAFQLSSFPQQFSLDTNLFPYDPQLLSLVDYYINGVQITPGKRFNMDNYFEVEIVRKDSVAFGGRTSTPMTILEVNCPKGPYVTFDVNDFSSLPTNVVNTQTKGCVITNGTLITAIS